MKELAREEEEETRGNNAPNHAPGVALSVGAASLHDLLASIHFSRCSLCALGPRGCSTTCRGRQKRSWEEMGVPGRPWGALETLRSVGKTWKVSGRPWVALGGSGIDGSSTAAGKECQRCQPRHKSRGRSPAQMAQGVLGLAKRDGTGCRIVRLSIGNRF